MKKLLFLFLITCCSCATKQKELASPPQENANDANDNKTYTISQIKFTSFTRGYQKSVTCTKDSVFIKINSSGNRAPVNFSGSISPEEWMKLINSLSGVNISKIGTLESPSQVYATDGALQSTIYINTLPGENFSSKSFDGTNPHEKLKKLMDTITEIEKKDR